MSAGLPDEADLPSLLSKAGAYVADLQRGLADARKEQSDLVQQRDQLALQLSITKRDKATQVANLRAENASLRAELQGAAATIEAHTLRLRTLEQQAAEQQASADAAAAGGREEVASLRARVQQVEAHCTQQAGQLSKVPALQQQLQACKAALEHQRNEAEAAEQRLRTEVGSLTQERNAFHEKYLQYKRMVQELSQAYSIIKDKMKRDRKERREEVRLLQDSLQAALAGQPQQQQAPGVEPTAHQAAARLVHLPTHSVPSSAGQDSLSDQLHLSVSQAMGRRPLSPGSDGPMARQASAEAMCGSRGITSALSQQPQLRVAPQRRCSSSDGRDGRPQGAAEAAAIVSPLQRRLEPPPLAEAPPAEEVWPEDEPPHPAPPAAPAPSPDGSQAEDPMEATQAVSPPSGQVVCTQLPAPKNQPQRKQRLARPHGTDLEAGHSKRQWRQSGARPGSMAPHAPTEQAVTARGAQQQQQQPLTPQRPGLAVEAGAPAEMDAPAARQPARLQGEHTTSQQVLGAGWKQAVRDNAAAHSAFELQAPARRVRTGGFQQGSLPLPPPLREANGGSKRPQEGNTGYAYQAVIRKRAERETLKGVECQQCHRFYAALESWGTIGQERVRLECGHVQQAQSGVSGGPAVLHRGQLMQEGSRHRYLFRPPDTQEGFWDMDVTQRSPPKRRQAESAQRHDAQAQLQEPVHEPQVFWQADDCDE